MSSKLIYVDETSSSSIPPRNPDPIEPRRPAEVSGNDCSQPGNSPSAPGPASRPGPASKRTSAHNDRGSSTLPNFNRVRCECRNSLECLNCFLRRTEAQEKEKFLKKPVFRNELLRYPIRPVISTFDPLEPAHGSVFRPGLTQQIRQHISRPWATSRSESRPVSASQRTAAGARNIRGCRLSTVLNSHGVRVECASRLNVDCCYDCSKNHFSVTGRTLSSILNCDEVSQRGSNNPQGGSNPIADVLHAGPAGSDSVGEITKRSPGVSSLQSAEPDQTGARSIVKCVSNASRLVLEDEKRKYSFNGPASKRILEDLAVLNERFGETRCCQTAACSFFTGLLVACAVINVIMVMSILKK